MPLFRSNVAEGSFFGRLIGIVMDHQNALLRGTRLRWLGRCRRQSLVEIGNDIVDMLDTDREAYIAGSHAARQLIRRT